MNTKNSNLFSNLGSAAQCSFPRCDAANLEEAISLSRSPQYDLVSNYMLNHLVDLGYEQFGDEEWEKIGMRFREEREKEFESILAKRLALVQEKWSVSDKSMAWMKKLVLSDYVLSKMETDLIITKHRFHSNFIEPVYDAGYFPCDARLSLDEDDIYKLPTETVFSSMEVLVF